MFERNLKHGRWSVVASEAEFRNLMTYGRVDPGSTMGSARVRKGEWAGPGRYLLLSYARRCPRDCCYDDVHEVLSAAEVAAEVRETMREWADLLREARRPAAP